jgi:hypothetical protein
MKSKLTLPHLLCLVLLLAFSNRHFAQISIPNGTFTNSENFSTLANTGTSSVVPTGWAFFETGTNANTLYTAGTGSSNTGDTYSLGLAANTERAFGGLQSGTLTPTVGVCYTNNTGSTITGLTVTYTGETWRVGTANRPDGIQFQYNQNTTAINGGGTWTSFSALDYFNPGFASAPQSGSMIHSALISSPISGLSIPDGTTFCFRWNSFDATGADDAVAVDDYALTNIQLAVCDITSVTFTNQGPCNNNGTPSDPSDDYFTADVNISFVNPPATGDLQIEPGGDAIGTYSIPVANIMGNSHTFAGVQLRADGTQTVIEVEFTVPANQCVQTVVGPTVASCSNAICDITSVTFTNQGPCNDNGTPSNPNDDYFTANININFVNPPPTGDLQIEPGGDAIGTYSIPVANIMGNSHTFAGVQLKADGTQTVIEVEFTVPANQCVQTVVGPTVASCSNGPSCEIIGYTFSNISSCNDNGTPSDPSDDYFTVNVDMLYSNSTNGDSLILTGGDLIFRRTMLAQVGTNLTSTFSTVRFRANGNPVNFTGQIGMFSNIHCSLPGTGPAVNSCASNPPVVLNCPAPGFTGACQSQAAVNAAFNAWLATATASGGCNGVLTNNNQGAPSACGGSTTVTFTYTSTCAPLTTTCQATFTVAAPPTVSLTCPVNTTVAACQTQAAVNTAFSNWLATASAFGGCNGVLTNNNQGAPSACGGSTTVTFTYTSSCAPTTTTCTATFTVPAASPVVLTCPVNTTVSPCLTQAQLNAAYANWLASATVTGGCGGSTVTNNAPAAPLICNPNSNTITVTFTYAGGGCQTSPVSCTSTFTVPAYPDFVMPANTASQVACPSQIVQPTPPAVLDGCGKTLTPTGPVIVNNPNPITCEGARTFTWTYTDCSGKSKTWSHVTTVERQPFSVPANGGATVACPDQTDTQPTPPVVTSNCGEVLTPVVTNTAKPGCEGNRNWNFTYTDCEGNTATWVFIYTVEYLDFTVPASETVTVECPLNASQPTPPIVKDNCGKTLTPTGPVITSTNNASGCEGSRKYAWTYMDCEGNTHVWSKTFNFLYTADFYVYPDGEDFVGCLLYAQPPVPPTIYGICGEVLKVTGPTVVDNSDGCTGTRKFTYIYSDCGGHSHSWSFTYHAKDNEPPIGTCPNVDVTDLACIEDVPCIDGYDFSDKIAELLAAGGFYDVCSGSDLTVSIESWTPLWQCSDADGDGVYTFGRTFNFLIEDACGNGFPSFCSVTYSGKCQPISTYSQGEWGNEGGEPGSSTPGGATDLQTITTLLGQGPLTIGGSSRSLTLTSAQCVLNLLPGVGNPTILGNCTQTNCNGCNPAGPIGMKNILATNTIALALNMRFSVQYNGLTMANVRSQDIGCIEIDPNIKTCTEGGVCKLHIFETNGPEHTFPYTLGGLLDLANLYLNGGLNLTEYESAVYAGALNKTIERVNAYWHDGTVATTCNPAGGAPAMADAPQKSLPTAKRLPKATLDFSLAPNPASNEVIFQMAELSEAQEVTFELYNYLGQQVLRKAFGKVSYINERIDLGGVRSGMYIVSIKAGKQRMDKKLFISK